MANHTKEDRKGAENFDKNKGGSETFNKTRDNVTEGFNKAKDTGTETFEKAKDVATDTFDKVKEAGSHVMEKARDTVGSMGTMATDTATAVGQKADNMTAAAGHSIKEFGDTIGRSAPHEGFAGKASQAVADTIRGSGQYLEQAKLSGIATDVEQVVRNHPVPAILICLGIGYCLGRVMSD